MKKITNSIFKVGDIVSCTWSTYGEAVYDKRGNMLHQKPMVTKERGQVYFVGEEIPGGAIVVRCQPISSVEYGFQFYLQELERSDKFTAHVEE